MGIPVPEKPHVQMDHDHHHGVADNSETSNKKWVITGIQFRTPLKPILTTSPVVVVVEKDSKTEEDGVHEEEEEECSTTPTAKESRIPAVFTCPPAPRKRKPSSRCHFNGGREFFTPPDLESVFIRRVERA